MQRQIQTAKYPLNPQLSKRSRADLRRLAKLPLRDRSELRRELADTKAEVTRLSRLVATGGAPPKAVRYLCLHKYVNKMVGLKVRMVGL